MSEPFALERVEADTQCSLCGRIIHAGEDAVVTEIWDWVNVRFAHPDCQQLSQEYNPQTMQTLLQEILPKLLEQDARMAAREQEGE